MKNDPKTPSGAHAEAGSWGGLFRVAIVGAASLKGRELKDVLNDRNFPAHDVRLLDDDESLGQLEAVGDEPTFIQSVLPEHMENVDFTFFASDENFTRNTWSMAKKAGSDIIDLSYGLEGEPDVAIRAPWVEREIGTVPAVSLAGAPVRIAHPAAMVLAVLLLRAQKVSKIIRAVATAFEPASERGKRGMDELHEQTVNLLSFQQLPKSVFDTQVAFNMVDHYGEKSAPSLETIEQRIQRHFKSIVHGKVDVPSLMLLQAPIFHGHAFSLYIEMERQAKVDELTGALAGEHVDVSQGGEDSPSNVNAAGQEHIQVYVRRDPVRENGFWLWAASDNLRIAALAAVECAESLVAGRPRGTVQ
ncbi:MAG TPA: Asd/ArgC dimerization domain-containing protein [Candidatus Limnocylindrales bacterium]|jgi:aspartate-semialdehyde dehydrogenase|nr:Asd/ArgC dimerization domain-containing protein [Candidatus Limnocylindrales bacterium]